MAINYPDTIWEMSYAKQSMDMMGWNTAKGGKLLSFLVHFILGNACALLLGPIWLHMDPFNYELPRFSYPP